MSNVADVYFNVASQSVFLDAPEGRPSSVTSVSIFAANEGDDGTAESATTGSPAVETSPDTTTDAVSGDGESNPKTINVTSTAGFVVGRKFLITAPDGEFEWFECREIDDGGEFVTARAPLKNAYPVGSTVESTRMTQSLLDSWVQDSANISDGFDPNPGYRVRWEYVVDSETVVRATYFDLVRYAGKHEVTPDEMIRFYPQWHETLPHDQQEDGGRALIDEAYQDVRWDLHKVEIADQMVRNQEAVDRLVKHKARERAVEARFYAGGTAADQVELARDAYESELNQLVRTTITIDIANDTTGGAGGRRSNPNIWRAR